MTASPTVVAVTEEAPLTDNEELPITSPEEAADLITTSVLQGVGLLTVALTTIVGGLLSSPVVEPLTQVLKQAFKDIPGLQKIPPTGIALAIAVVIWVLIQATGYFGYGDAFLKWFGAFEKIIPVVIAAFGSTAGAHAIYQAASKRDMGFIGAPRN